MSDDDYGFEYSDDDQEEEDVNIENRYYNAKGDLKDGMEDEALTGFKEVVSMEEEKGEWGFKVRVPRRRAGPSWLPRTALVISPPLRSITPLMTSAFPVTPHPPLALGGVVPRTSPDRRGVPVRSFRRRTSRWSSSTSSATTTLR